MKNYLQAGDTITYTNTGSTAISSGDPVQIGSLFGVAITDIAATSGTGEVKLCGVFELDKTASQAWTQGALLYWDATNSKATTASSGNKIIGCAWAAATAAATEGQVRLNAATVN